MIPIIGNSTGVGIATFDCTSQMMDKTSIAVYGIFTVLIVNIRLSAASGWAYRGTHGLDEWCDVSKTCCGKQQSPVNLPTNVPTRKVYEFQYNNNYHRTPSKMTITNNGHSVVISIPGDIQPRMRGGGLRGEYIFSNLHFHWGNSSYQGSEHTIGGRAYPMEAHLVHYSARFKSLDEAVNSGEKDALAVLGVFITNSRARYNQPFYRITSQLENVEYEEQTTEITPFPLVDVLPSDEYGFYRYFGSLTTPGCNEIVVWTVFVDPLPVPWSMIDNFRYIYSTEENEIPQEPLVDNFRPTQPLNGRTIHKLYPNRNEYNWH